MEPLADDYTVGRRHAKLSKIRPWVLAAVSILTVLFQVYVPLFFEPAAAVDLPLLAVIYLAVLRRRPVAGTFIGAGIGLLQDSLSRHPLGMFGIAKTVVGYAAASLSLRVDADRTLVRFLLVVVFFLLHQACYWALRVLLLGELLAADPAQTLVLATVSGAMGIAGFGLLDKLKKED